MKAEPKRIEQLARFLCKERGYDPDELRPGNMAFHSSFDPALFSDAEYDHLFDKDPEYAPDGYKNGDKCMFWWRDFVELAVGILKELELASLEDEEQKAAHSIGDLVTSVMCSAYNESPRRPWLYVWERAAMQWLLRFKQRRPEGTNSSAWVTAFLKLNEDAINQPHGLMDFNLRKARLAEEARARLAHKE